MTDIVRCSSAVWTIRRFSQGYMLCVWDKRQGTNLQDDDGSRVFKGYAEVTKEMLERMFAEADEKPLLDGSPL